MRIQTKHHNRWAPCLALAASLLLGGSPAYAVVYRWDGDNALDSNWQEADNWTPSGVPEFNGTFVHRLDVNGAAELVYDQSLGTTVYDGSVGSGGRGLVVGSGTRGSGSMRITGGTFSTAGSTSPDVVGNSGYTGTLILDGGNYINTAGFDFGVSGSGHGVLIMTSGTVTIPAFRMSANTSRVDLNGGVLEVNSISRPSGTGTFNFNGGTLRARQNNASFMTGLSRANVRDGGAVIDTNGLDVNIAQALLHSDIDGDAAVDGGLTKQGGGALALSGANTYTGDTVIEGGTLLLNNPLALRYSPLNYDNQGGTLGFGTLTAATIGGLIGSQNLPASTSLTALTLNPRGGLEAEYSGIINDGGGGLELIKTGAGAQILTGANSYTGETRVNAGVLRVTNANALGTTDGAVTVASGARLELAGGITVQGKPITISGQGGGVGALQSHSGANTWAEDVTLGASGTRIGANGLGQSLTISGAIGDGSNNYTLAVRNADDGGTTILSGANTYGGGTDVVVGVLQIAGGHDRLPTGTVLRIGNTSNVASATFDLNGFNQQVAGLTDLGSSMSRTVTNSSTTLSTLTVNNASDNTYAGTITGNLALVKNGGGTLTLSGANTFTGETVVNAGTLELDHSLALRYSPLDYDNQGGTIDFGTLTAVTIGGLKGSQDLPASSLTALTLDSGSGVTATYSGGINDGGGGLELIKSGGGTQILAGTNTYTGQTKVNTGVLRITNAGALGTTDGAVTVTSGARLELAGGITVVGQPITIAGTGGNNIGGLQSQSGANTWTGDVTLGASGARIGANGVDQSLTVSGVIGDGGTNRTLAVRNADAGGTTILSGVNTYGGGTDIVVGLLQIAGGDDRLPTGTVLRIGNTSNVGSATFDLNGFYQQVAGLTDLVGATGTPMTRTITNSSDTLATLTVNNASNFTYRGTITGNLVLSKNGAAQLTLSGANSFTGPTVIEGGTLRLDHSLALQNSPLNYDNQGGAVDFGTLTSVTIGGLKGSQNLPMSGLTALTLNPVAGAVVSYAGVIDDGAGGLTLTKSGAGTQILTGNNSYTGTTTISGGTLQIGDGGTAGSLGGGNIVNNAALVIHRSDDVTVGQVISGSGSLTKQGSNTLILTGNNSFIGGTTIAEGRLLVQGSGRLANAGGVLVAEDAILELSTGSWLYGGTISGDGGLIKSGTAGDVRLTGTNTYTGPTLVTGSAALRAGSAQAFGINSALTVASGAAAELNGWSLAVGSLSGGGTIRNASVMFYGPGPDTPTILTVGGDDTSTLFSGVIEDGSQSNVPVGDRVPLGLTKVGEGTLTLSGTNTYTGPTTISYGTLQVGAGGGIGTLGTGHIVNDAALVVNRTGTLTLNQSISGTGTLTRLGSGTLVLSGDNSYTGTTTISAGQLTIAHDNALGSPAGGTAVAGGATLALQGGISVAEAITIGTHPTLGTIRNLSGDNTLSENITKAGPARFQSDAGMFTIGGDVGGTDNSVYLSGSGDGRVLGNIGPAWNLFKEGSGTWTVQGSIATLNGDALAVQGGTLILAGNNTYARPTNISAGTLLVNGSTAAASTVTVNAGAALGGTGSIGGPTTIRGGGTLSPGQSIGTLSFGNALTLENGAVWDWEFLNNTAGNYDQVVGPTLILPTDSDSLITLNILGLPGHSVNWYDEFVLFTGQVENFDAGLFNLVNDSNWTRGWAISVGNSLILTAVPEPGTWLMLLGMLVCGLLVRRGR
ncbi:MAG: autotransporter-associated beta strand repeat-containing protein [Thermoguttaceae bacterium]|jgi:autotransporter-associated beta strand protein|nr:autotransporter-associated beta strand repeat-containing protein [Thermoguttaceae bacterium]